PYLIEFPYGCTEQTLSRFVPAAIVANTLHSRGLDAEAAMARAFGGIEPGSVEATRRGEASKRIGLDRLDEVTASGLERLASMQHADGGWGWWSSGASDAHMTAYVVWGLSLAEEAGVDVDSGIVDRGAEFLRERLFEAENQVDLQAWMLHALGAHSQRRDGRWKDHETVDLAFRNAFEKREGLQAYGVALLALAAHGLQRADDAQTLIENLRSGVKIDDAVDSSVIAGQQGSGTAPARAYWGASGSWRRWSRSPIETTATALRALLAIDPKSDLIDPVSSWLIANRRAAQWSNTRDTAMCVLALNDLLEKSGELDRPIAYRVLLNGEEVGAVSLTLDQRLTRPSVFAIPPDQVGRTDNVIEVVRTEGSDSLDVAVYAEFFTNEARIPARGSEIFVSREYYKLVPRPTLLGGLVYDRIPLEDRGAIQSGERVEVVCTVDAKSDLEYLLFEDLKPAGFEAVQVKSGSPLTLRELKQSEVEERFG
ncbi:MAG: alpha-2-macroglobulin, partial [Planctomycetota bacterium]